MYDIYAQKSNYNFKGKVLTGYRLFQNDTLLEIEQHEAITDDLQGYWKFNEGKLDFDDLDPDVTGYMVDVETSAFIDGEYIQREKLYFDVTGDIIVTHTIYAYNGNLSVAEIRATGVIIYRDYSNIVGARKVKQLQVLTAFDADNERHVNFKNFMQENAEHVADYIKYFAYKKGEKNPYFKVIGEEFLFNITSNDIVEKKQPITNLVLKSDRITVDTKFMNERFVEGGYVLFEDKLWVIKSVSKERGPNKSINAFFNVNPLATTKMVWEEAQE